MGIYVMFFEQLSYLSENVNQRMNILEWCVTGTGIALGPTYLERRMYLFRVQNQQKQF